MERDVPGISTGGDVLVAVRARLDEFARAAEAWVLRELWAEFLRQLVRLEGG